MLQYIVHLKLNVTPLLRRRNVNRQLFRYMTRGDYNFNQL